MCSLAKITSLLSLLKVVVGQLVLPPPAGTAALPIIPNHALLDLSAESRLMTQLRSWGIDIQLDLDVNILGLELLNTRPRRRSRETERGLNLKLDLGLDRIVSGLVNIGLGDKLGINADVRIGSWGQADSATRGERGDSAVSPRVVQRCWMAADPIVDHIYRARFSTTVHSCYTRYWIWRSFRVCLVLLDVRPLQPLVLRPGFISFIYESLTPLERTVSR
jgi:hypothetical protein